MTQYPSHIIANPPQRDRIAVMHGGPLGGKEYPIFGPIPEEMPTPVPTVFTVVQGQYFLIYRAREGFATSDGIRYDYDWSHARPRTED